MILFSTWVTTLVIFALIAYIIHQMLIDAKHHYSNDNSSLDELSYRKLFAKDIESGIFFWFLIVGLYVLAIWLNPYLHDNWINLIHHLQDNFNRG